MDRRLKKNRAGTLPIRTPKSSRFSKKFFTAKNEAKTCLKFLRGLPEKERRRGPCPIGRTNQAFSEQIQHFFRFGLEDLLMERIKTDGIGIIYIVALLHGPNPAIRTRQVTIFQQSHPDRN
ncbi:hypothetical protein QEH56_03840 [Pelagicoccus enzymogenes]|uniref:hypothetical protein n=1 Tax=Pelagicoccus enzymogenes TaxID=2773457 RepID=UPI00280F1343|nr:hypothetical protein [Pelagicoccus enzymogenes]MDQ8197262.1 hypothetical protein [Pelagicoccus enzymogenes]